MVLSTWWQSATQLFTGSSQQCLERALRSAIAIRNIEKEYFQGNPIAAENTDYGTSVIAYCTKELQKNLRRIENELYHLNNDDQFTRILQLDPAKKYDEKTDLILDQLNFIDSILASYDGQLPAVNGSSSSKISNINPLLDPEHISQSKQRRTRETRQSNFRYVRQDETQQKLESATGKSGVLPRSFLRTVNRLKEEMAPQSGSTEQKVLKQYRNSRYKTALSVKFLLTLVIVPLLVHQLSKTFFLLPSVDRYFQRNEEIIFINQNMEAEAYEELHRYEESLKFRAFLGLGEKIEPDVLEEKLAEKAVEISKSFRRSSTNAIANIFADILSLVSFVIVIVSSQREIEVLKEFIDEIVYGLSDSAKAFLIILFTDMFVGFHSPHGWEVILASVARHFGLPENEDFNFLFIATFPVILDTVFKYWIFRYLNGISPSAVATYRNMNE